MKEKKVKRNFLKMSGPANVPKVSPATALSQAVSKGEIKINSDKSSVFLSASQKDSGMEVALIQAVETATDFSWLKTGQTVFIKPALNSSHHYPATTNPVAVAAVIRLLKQKGAGKVIVGDMSGIQYLRFFKDRTTGSTRALMKKSGMMEAVVEAGGEPHFFEEGGWDSFYKDYTDTKGFWSDGIMMPAILKNVDHIVLMPRCSRHVLAGASLGLKAAVGYWRTDTRLEYHYHAESLHERTAEGNRVKTLLDKQRLVISTGDKLLATFGPDKGYVHKPSTGLVIVSESVVAHDMVSLAWLLHNRKLLPVKKQDTLMDSSRSIARLGNTLVVKWLGTWRNTLTSEALLKNDLQSVWDDRVLNHSYRIFGGIPNIRLENVKDAVPAEIINSLYKMIHYS